MAEVIKLDKEKEIRAIIKHWQNDGEKELKNRVPVHPEFIYRFDGEWQGWNDLLSVDMINDREKFIANRTRDELEDEAFARYIKLGMKKPQ